MARVASGSFHTVALTKTGEVFSWGCGRDGQLGHGDWGSPRVPHLVKALQGKDVIQVAKYISPNERDLQSRLWI